MSNKIDTQSLNSQHSLIDLAGARVQLRKKSAKEWEGPCQKCGGADRFYVTDEWFACRQCHPKRGDAIEFVMWADGLEFLEACESLGSADAMSLSSGEKIAPARAAKPAQSQGWRDAAATRMEEAVELLGSAEGAPGRAYLASRGLNQDTWSAYGLGFTMAYLPYTWDNEVKKACHPRQPAIAIPWRNSDGNLVGIRYRFLQTDTYTDLDGKERKENKTALWGSDFAGRLFGYQSIDPASIPADRTLVIVEGEINAMSIYQNASAAGVDVLSIGSEGQKPRDLARLAERYGNVIVWADRADVAKTLMGEASGAFGVSSPNGKDANDLLKAGTLGGYLSAWRMEQCKSNEQIASLHQWLTRATEKGAADKGMNQVLSAIARKLAPVAPVPVAPALRPKEKLILIFEPGSVLYGPAEGFKVWLWEKMQSDAGVLADMFTLCGYLTNESQEITIEHPHADVLTAAARYLISTKGAPA